MARFKTEAALVASLIRKELKRRFPDTKFRVRSSTFSGGNSVDISWEDGPTEAEVDKVVGKYQMGHFNGMTDTYEYSNRRRNLPQVKYVQTYRTLSNKRVLELIALWGYNDIGEDEINKTNQELFDKYNVWTFRQLARRIERWLNQK